MKKQTLIIIALCVLVAAVIALNVTGVIGPQDEAGSLAGYTIRNNEVSPPNTIPPLVVNPEYSFPSTP